MRRVLYPTYGVGAIVDWEKVDPQSSLRLQTQLGHLRVPILRKDQSLKEVHLPKITDLTDASSVASAILEFRRLGRSAFLVKYGFPASIGYYLLDDGTLIDTMPLVAAAYGIQDPHHGPLMPGEFTGWPREAESVLKNLGFQVGTRAQLCPPRIGDEYANRTAIYNAYGGNKVGGIVRFPWERIVNVFSDAEGPYADDPPALIATFGYRGQGLNGPQRVDQGGNAYLEEARLNAEAIRFWYRPKSGSFTFLTWAVVLGRNWVPGVGKDGFPRPEIDWQLEPVHTSIAAEWPTGVQESLRDAQSTTEDDSSVPEAAPHASYVDLVQRVESRSQKKRPTGVVRTDYARSAAARRAVLVRSNGKCESKRCTGMPADLNRRGQPILDVDHVVDLAKGGKDHPQNMVALCPNCHAAKTRGVNSDRWRRELVGVAEAAHASSLGYGAP